MASCIAVSFLLQSFEESTDNCYTIQLHLRLTSLETVARTKLCRSVPVTM